VAPHVSAAIVADIDQQQQRHEEIITRLDRITEQLESLTTVVACIVERVFYLPPPLPVPEVVTAFLAGVGHDAHPPAAAQALAPAVAPAPPAIEEQQQQRQSPARCGERPSPRRRPATAAAAEEERDGELPNKMRA